MTTRTCRIRITAMNTAKYFDSSFTLPVFSFLKYPYSG